MNALEFADTNIVVYAVGQDSGIYIWVVGLIWQWFYGMHICPATTYRIMQKTQKLLQIYYEQ